MSRQYTLRTFQIENVVFVDFSRPAETECTKDQQLKALQAFLDAFIVTAGRQAPTSQPVASQLQDALGRILDTAGLSLIPHTGSEKS